MKNLNESIWKYIKNAFGLVFLILPNIALSSTHYPVEEKSIMTLQAEMSAGNITSEQLVKIYRKKIKKIDRSGPKLHSVIVLNPHAKEDARRLDAERREGHVRGPLHGIPILVKDNIETNDGTATTAGSLTLKDNVSLRDAPIIQKLKQAGVVILGKTNLSEWNNIRSSQPISGWSAIRGLVKNPYVLDHSAGGSSSGTGAAIAASLATAGLGTETDGSLISPAAFCGLVALKPTVGLVSRSRVIPISHWQDTPGPMGRSVEDVAIMLTAIAGSDRDDAATAKADEHRQDYQAVLETASLKGKRLGMLSFGTGFSSEVDKVFFNAVKRMKAEGAEIIVIKDYQPPSDLMNNELSVLLTELKHNLNAYLSTTPASVKTRTLKDVVEFNRVTGHETVWFDQEYFEQALKKPEMTDQNYRKMREQITRQATVEGIDKLITDYQLDALIVPSYGPAWQVDHVSGDHYKGKSTILPAIAGYPHLTVPMGQIHGLPVGISFIGPAWSEDKLLALGYAFERMTQARKPPTFIPSFDM